MQFVEQRAGEIDVIRGDGAADIFLLCDHASNTIPREYNGLGVDAAARCDHVAWDIGAADVVRAMARQLGAAAVLGTVSRLVVDLNRRPRAPDVIPPVSHGCDIANQAGQCSLA